MSSVLLNSDDLNAKICQQLEYYFGDENLERDKFLLDEIKKDHGWVPLDVLLTFNRLKQLTTDKDVTIAAVKDSKIVKVSKDKEKLRRNPALPFPAENKECKAAKEALKNEIDKNTGEAQSAAKYSKGQVMHVSGLPPKTDSYALFVIFNKYAPVADVTHKRGSSEANIRFHSKEENTAVKALERMKKKAAAETNGKIQFQGHDIKCKILEDKKEKKYWFAKSMATRKNLKNKGRCGSKVDHDLCSIVWFSCDQVVYVEGFPKNATAENILEFLKPYCEDINIGMRRFKRNKGFKGSAFVMFKDKASAQHFAQIQEPIIYNDVELIKMMQKDFWAINKERKAAATTKYAENALKRQKHNNKPYKNTNEAHAATFLKGQVMHVSGLPFENVNFGLLKDFFKQYAPVAHAAYESGSSEASIRFQSNEENAAIKALQKINETAAETEILFQGQNIECKILEGEEEEKYWLVYLKKSEKSISKVKAKPAKTNEAGYLDYVYDTFDYLKGMIWNSNE